MRQMFVVTTLALTLVGLLGASQLSQRTTAQVSTPTTAEHPLVGTWVVDTISASNTDSPEIAVVTSDGGLAGLGANRVAGGRWQPTSPTVAELTLVSIFDGADGAGYIIVRGPHEVDATGEVQRALPFPIRKLQSDNGSEFPLAFSLSVREAGIRYRYIKPRHPEQNGKVERSHRIDHEEFWSRHTFADFESAVPALAAWEQHYDYERFSLALQGHTPAEKLELRLPFAQSA